MNYYSFLFLILAFGIFIGRPVISIPLGEANIGLITQGDTSSTVLLYNMHDNENTSAIAGRILSRKYGGQYYELIHTGMRNIGIPQGEDTVWIDPNRIYTDEGIRQQLEKNEIESDTALFELIATWRDTVLSILRIRERSLVIALHNNTNKAYSLESYLPEGVYELEADTIYQGHTRDLDDFYFVTDQEIFDKLSGSRYHVVLQANETATDDGSLSVYCARFDIPYVNVEAQHKHLFRQLRMLVYAYERLR